MLDVLLNKYNQYLTVTHSQVMNVTMWPYDNTVYPLSGLMIAIQMNISSTDGLYPMQSSCINDVESPMSC